MILTVDFLHKLSPKAADFILEGIVDYQYILPLHGIIEGNRLNMFLAQIAHESDGFRTTREYASGAAYEGRADLGNTEPGDGKRFRGRGLIQLTGRANYAKFSEHFNVDILAEPELVEEFPIALDVSAAFWESRNLNKYADQGDFRTITKRINGGFNGMVQREYYLDMIQSLIGKEHVDDIS